MRRLTILKLGGTSIGSANGLRNAVAITSKAASDSRVVVVASALAGVTNQLVNIEYEWRNKTEYHKTARCGRNLEWLWNRHVELASVVLEGKALNAYLSILTNQLRWIREEVLNIEYSLHGADSLFSVGERLSVPLVSFMLRENGHESGALDSASLIRTNANFGNARIAMDPTSTLLQTWFRGLTATTIPVVTGFIGSCSDGRTTTLGRSGTDYSAAAIAVALGAHVVERWTDTDGIYTANPNEDDNADHIPRMSLPEAIRRHRKSGVGVHAKALDLLQAAGIPLHVRSTVARSRRGSWVVPTSIDRPALPCVCDWRTPGHEQLNESQRNLAS